MTPNETAAPGIVCLVDDDPAVLRSLGRLLASDGFSVHAFNQPKNFLAHVRGNTVPLVILDIWMEQMTGLEVQAELCKLSPQTRVIIMTGCQDITTQQTALQSGAVGFFIKPFDDEQFLGAVRRALDDTSSK